VSVALPIPVIQLLQVLTVALGAPGVTGVIAKVEARLGAAFWYERVIHDRFGVVPEGHLRLAPLIRPGPPEKHVLPRHVTGSPG
jgi:NADH:ubiquinone oxidoreductase subunit C